ncbi:MAG TPA: 3'-5' exonuclease [Trichocoleus sp.]|jgi:DNA polymerase-3 subunit epsilon
MSDQQKAAKWAFDLLQTEFCILDTETTGLGPTAEICQIAVTSRMNEVLFNSLVCPTVPIEPDASAIHGLTAEDVAAAPTFEEVLIPLMKAIAKRDLIIYNCEFDLKLIRQSARVHGIPLAFPTSDRRQCRIWLGGGSIQCAMLQYSAWCGEWNDYYGNYRWQKLPGGDHTALGDCLATAKIINEMAASYKPVEPVQEYSEIDF